MSSRHPSVAASPVIAALLGLWGENQNKRAGGARCWGGGRCRTPLGGEPGDGVAELMLESEHRARAGPHGSSVTGIFYYFGSPRNGSM